MHRGPRAALPASRPGGYRSPRWRVHGVPAVWLRTGGNVSVCSMLRRDLPGFLCQGAKGSAARKGYRPAMFPVRLVAAALAAPPVLSCHTHRSLSSEKCWDSKNNGRPVQSSRRFPYTIRCFSVPQGWVSCYRRILISFRAFQDYPQGIR